MKPLGLIELVLRINVRLMLRSVLSAAIRWAVDLATLASQAVNSLLLRGSVDETISARCYRLRERLRWRTAYRVINALFFWQANHCASSYAADVTRAGWLLQQHRPTVADDV